MIVIIVLAFVLQLTSLILDTCNDKHEKMVRITSFMSIILIFIAAGILAMEMI